MKKVDLIVCDEDGSWDSNIIVEIPEHLHLMHDVDAIAAWLVENLKERSFEHASYIGVYNWDPDY
jgi:hypothetical protein